MKTSFIVLALALLMAGCNKAAESILDNASQVNTNGQFIKYTIQKGNNYCDQNSLKAIETNEMKFTVRFDSTAIYQTVDPLNQDDINKLYGFSDNNMDHHQYSARFGWRWSEGALRLFAYVYNEGLWTEKELSVINIGQEVSCSISVAGTSYLFKVNGAITEMPRKASTEKGKGYQLYPYFGGDETAPHLVNIWVRNDN
jgi:hypothetical protein